MNESCGCCAGTRPLTPADTANRPGLDAILCRIGTHSTFLETMQAAQPEEQRRPIEEAMKASLERVRLRQRGWVDGYWSAAT